MSIYSPTEHRKYLRFTQLLNGAMAAIACAVGAWILLSPDRATDPQWLYLLIWPIATLHTVEEYIFPGKFLNYFNKYAFDSPTELGPLTAKRAFLTDTLTGIFNPVILILFGTFFLPGVWFFVGLLTINGAFHLLESIRRGNYFPGLVTAILLYFPGFAYITWFYLDQGLISGTSIALTFALAGLATAGFFRQVRGWQAAE
ncbi:HXXEE domain-containing protein [Devosia sp. Naph2]|uniref:HXXEE domain-containing protein n=1 Tax=Devosia polycyclovorans TaxID=3345148 RepID=UPI0035CFF6FF